MSQSRFWTVLALLSALVLAGFPAGVDAQSSAAAPAAMTVSGAEFDAQTSAVDLATDPSGRYAVVATTAPSEVFPSVDHLHAYDMQSGTYMNTGTVRYPFKTTPTDQPPALGGVVGLQDSSSPGRYVVGAERRIQVYTLGGTGLADEDIYRDTGASAKVVAVAMNGPGTHVVAAINHATPIPGVTMETSGASAFSNITVFDHALKAKWRAVFPAAITAMAVRGPTVAVATETHLYVFNDYTAAQPAVVNKCDSSVRCKSFQLVSGATTERASVLRLSANGAWLLLGTDQGKAHLFRTTDQTLSAGLRSTPSHPGDGAVRGMAMNADGTGAPSIFAIVWDNGNLRVYRHDPAAAIPNGLPVTNLYQAKVPGTGVAGGTGKPSGLSMSLSNPYSSPPAPHPYMVIPVGGTIYGFTTAPPGTGAKAPGWAIEAGATILEAVITSDAERVVAITAGKMLGFKQVTRAAIIPKTFLENGVTRPLVGKPVVPGTVVNYQFDLKNDGTTDDSYVFPWAVNPPSGWGSEGREGIALRAGERATVSFNITVPSDAAPTSHDFTLLVHSLLKDTSSVCGPDANRPCAIKFFANVTRVSKIEVVPSTDSMRNLTVVANQRTEFTFDVRNRGNARTFPVNLSVAQKPSSGSPWNVTLDKQFNLALDGGGVVRVTGSVTPPPSALNGQFTVIEVSALVTESAVGAPLKIKALLNPSYGVQLGTEKPLYSLPGGRTPILVKVQNTGNTEQNVQLSFNITPRAALDKDYRLEAPTFSVTLPEAGKSKTWTLYVSPLAEFPEQATITVDAFVRESPTKKDSLTINIERLPEDIPPCDSVWCRLTPGPGALLGALAAAGAAVILQRKR